MPTPWCPAVLFCDEIEKGLERRGRSSGTTDSGVSARLFGSLLTWLNDHESDVFFIGTCNDISKLPPEFSRAERFDGDILPGSAQRAAEAGDLEALPRPVPVGLATAANPSMRSGPGPRSGACCRLAALLDVPLVEAAQNVVPVATTAAESVSRLRNWASGRCLNADAPGGIYTANPDSGLTVKPGRKVRRAGPVEQLTWLKTISIRWRSHAR